MTKKDDNSNAGADAKAAEGVAGAGGATAGGQGQAAQGAGGGAAETASTMTRGEQVGQYRSITTTEDTGATESLVSMGSTFDNTMRALMATMAGNVVNLANVANGANQALNSSISNAGANLAEQIMSSMATHHQQGHSLQIRQAERTDVFNTALLGDMVEKLESEIAAQLLQGGGQKAMSVTKKAKT